MPIKELKPLNSQKKKLEINDVNLNPGVFLNILNFFVLKRSSTVLALF